MVFQVVSDHILGDSTMARAIAVRYLMRNGLYRSLPMRYLYCSYTCCDATIRFITTRRSENYSGVQVWHFLLYMVAMSPSHAPPTLSPAFWLPVHMKKRKEILIALSLLKGVQFRFLTFIQVVHSLDVRAFYLLATHDRIHSIVHCRVRRSTRLAYVPWFEGRGIR
jgi:hypothetical protein